LLLGQEVSVGSLTIENNFYGPVNWFRFINININGNLNYRTWKNTSCYSMIRQLFRMFITIPLLWKLLHQVSISSSVFARIFCTKVLFSSYVLAKKALSYQKCVRKMLMKLTAGLNIKNILWAAFCTEVFCAAFMFLQLPL